MKKAKPDADWTGPTRTPSAPGASEYVWASLWPGLVRASADHDARAVATFLAQWHAQATRAYDALIVKPDPLGKHSGAIVDMARTVRSIELLTKWWLPQLAGEGPTAAEGLRGFISRTIRAYRDSLEALITRSGRDYDPGFVASMRGRIDALSSYMTDDDVIGRVAFRLGGYDPRRDSTSPQQAVEDAIRETLAPLFRESFPVPASATDTVAKEVRRRLRQAEGHPDRTEAEAALAKLSDADRAYLLARHGPNGSLDNARMLLSPDGKRAAGNSKSDTAHDHALRALIDVMPELAALPLKEAAKARPRKTTS